MPSFYNIQSIKVGEGHGDAEMRWPDPHSEPYFLNKFSKACLASMGRAEAGVEVCFSMRTLIE